MSLKKILQPQAVAKNERMRGGPARAVLMGGQTLTSKMIPPPPRASHRVAIGTVGPDPEPSPPSAGAAPQWQEPTTTVLASLLRQSVARKWTKPVGAAVLLLAVVAHADTQVITAPQGGQGACPFPGCRAQNSILDVTEPPYNVFPGAPDMSGPIQAAIDSGMPTLYFPAGTYAMCNVAPRAQNQRWVGAGRDQTFIVATTGCNNPVATSFSGVFGGPNFTFSVEGFTFKNAVQNDLTINCRDVSRVVVRNNAFDVCAQNGTSGQQNGLALLGCQNALVENNEFYSSCPHKGKAITVNDSVGAVVRNNTIKWTGDGIYVQGAANTAPTEGTLVDANTIAMNWWATPTRFTNSGGTVTYGANTLTDTAANFTGLCGDTGAPGACGGSIGNFVRVMTPLATGTTATFNTNGLLTDTGANFTGAGVRRGDLVRTTSVCFGNGPKPQTQRFVCTGSAGSGAWGDSCVCTAHADCASSVCEPRLGIVMNVGSATVLQVDEWVRESACPLGSSLCAEATRRPTDAILSTAGVAYTIFRWAMGVVASYTSTVITTNSAVYNWFDWNGTVSTPSNGTLYEVLYAHPNVPILAGFTSNQNNVVTLRVTNNFIEGGWADNIFVVGQNFIVANNRLLDGQDHGIDIQGAFHTVTGNQVGHMGVRGVACINTCNDSVIAQNEAWDTPWVNSVGTTSFGDLVIQGARNTVIGNKVSGRTPVTNNRYGIVVTATSDQNLLTSNTCTGTYSAGCFRFDGAGATNSHVIDYHGETISNNAGTYSIEGGLCTFAQLPANAANGSTVGCSDCNATCAAGASNGHSCERVGGVWTN